MDEKREALLASAEFQAREGEADRQIEAGELGEALTLPEWLRKLSGRVR